MLVFCLNKISGPPIPPNYLVVQVGRGFVRTKNPCVFKKQTINGRLFSLFFNIFLEMFRSFPPTVDLRGGHLGDVN